MRSVPALVVLVSFLLTSLFPVQAHCREEFRLAEIEKSLERWGKTMEKEHLELRDSESRLLQPGDLVRKNLRQFQMVLKQAGRSGLQFRVKIGEQALSPFFSITVVDEDSSKVLSRRSFRLDPREKSESVRIRFEQTVYAMEKEISRQLAQSSTKTDSWRRVAAALTQVFGIPSAQASCEIVFRLVLAYIGTMSAYCAWQLFLFYHKTTYDSEELLSVGGMVIAGVIAIYTWATVLFVEFSPDDGKSE